MRIALVTPTRSDPAHRRLARALACEFRRRGHRVRWLTSSPGARTRFDVCHVHWFARGFEGLGLAAWPEGARLVLTHQAASFGLIEHPAAFGALARRAGLVTTVSRRAARELAVSIQKRAAVVPNGVAPARRTARPARSRTTLLAVSRIAAYKGLDTLALAFASLKDRRPGLRLEVYGPDQTGGRFARFVRRLGLGGRVELRGDRPEREVDRALARCEAFVLPSRQENLPMALLEAMAAGRPIVACRVGGVPEAVRHGREALLVPPGSPAALGRALRSLLERPALARRLGRAAARRARRFTWRNVATNYLEAYRTLLDASPRKRAPSAREKGR
ncbi:MAG: glycosyltransferase family 4 protein [Elusimicrobia bacterium]|nr:glycosyltransferase family 4 protein [Elusimicrobiota bacterium]